MRLARATIFPFLSALLLFSAAAASETGDISISSRVDKSKITIGDLVKYTVEVKRAPGIKVEMPELGANLGAFELRDYNVREPVTRQDTVIERVDYTISTFEVGEFEIPPLTFYFTTPPDSIRRALTTQKIRIVVESMKPSQAGDVRDIKAPLVFPMAYRKYIIWGSIVFAFLVLCAVSFYIWRRRRAGKGILPQKVEPPRPAHELALEALQALKDSSLLRDGKIKEYYIELSEIIRRYVEGRYFIVALEMTTDELVQELRGSDVPREDVNAIRDFLSVCDLVKFAKHKPAEGQHDEMWNEAFALVERTKIIYEMPFEQDGNGDLAEEATEVAAPATLEGEGAEG